MLQQNNVVIRVSVRSAVSCGCFHCSLVECLCYVCTYVCGLWVLIFYILSDRGCVSALNGGDILALRSSQEKWSGVTLRMVSYLEYFLLKVLYIRTYTFRIALSPLEYNICTCMFSGSRFWWMTPLC